MLKTPVRRQMSVAVLIAAVVLAGVPTAYLVWQSRSAQAQAPPGGPSVTASPAPASASGVGDSGPADKTTTAPDTLLASRESLSAGSHPEPSSGGGDAARERPALPPISFAQIKLLQLNDRTPPRDQEVLVTFNSDALDVLDGPRLVQRTRYQDVIGLFHSHSREPRWTNSDGTPMPLAKLGGRFAFLKGASDWITVQTAAGFIPLHVPDSELPRLVSELETRTGTHVVRTK